MGIRWRSPTTCMVRPQDLRAADPDRTPAAWRAAATERRLAIRGGRVGSAVNEGSERERIEAGFRREDADFYCLHCAYPLRGLPGDPIRCPECFCLNPRSKLLVVRIRRFEKVLHKLDQTAYRAAILYFALELTTAIVFLWRRLAAPVWLLVFASSSAQA